VYETVISFDPQNKNGYTEKGKTLDKLKRHKEAHTAYKAASNLPGPAQSIQSSAQKTTWLYKEPFRYDS